MSAATALIDLAARDFDIGCAVTDGTDEPMWSPPRKQHCSALFFRTIMSAKCLFTHSLLELHGVLHNPSPDTDFISMLFETTGELKIICNQENSSTSSSLGSRRIRARTFEGVRLR
jgi:hypothetical protein